MISKIRSGILSCIGLIFISLLHGIVFIPGLELKNFIVYLLVIQVGALWFSISLWIVLRYDLVKLNNLKTLAKPIDWLIRNIAFVSVLGIISSYLPNKGIKLLSILLAILLVINYIVVFVKIYKLNKQDLEYIDDLKNSMITMIVIFIVLIIYNAFNELIWHINLDFVFYFLWSLPVLFQMRYLLREKKDIENKLRENLINLNNNASA